MALRFRRSSQSSAAPAQDAQKHLQRPSAHEIYQQVASNARQELKRSSISLAISGFAGGTFMGLSALGNGIALAMLGNSTKIQFVAKMFYPLGFIVVILGRSQLFTENTLYPVALVLAEKRHFWNTLRLWGVVLPSNVLGAFSFASLVSLTDALRPEIVHALAHLGTDALNNPPSAVFWSGVMGGWIIALAAWLVSGSHSITGSVMIIWMLTFVVGLGNFAHCIATSGEILVAVLTHQAPWRSYPAWLFPAVAGNICGGVGMVTLIEYGQVIYGGDSKEIGRRGGEDGLGCLQSAQVPHQGCVFRPVRDSNLGQGVSRCPQQTGQQTATIVRFHQLGSPEVLTIEALPMPEPAAGLVRLRVKAIGLNRAEVLFRQGRYRLVSPELPSKLGYEASGVVEAVGPGVDTSWIGKTASTVQAFPANVYRSSSYPKKGIYILDSLAVLA